MYIYNNLYNVSVIFTTGCVQHFKSLKLILKSKLNTRSSIWLEKNLKFFSDRKFRIFVTDVEKFFPFLRENYSKRSS